METQRIFDSVKDKPQFTFSHMCHLWLLWHEGLLEEGSFSLNPQPEADEKVQKRARRNDDDFDQGPIISPTNMV